MHSDIIPPKKSIRKIQTSHKMEMAEKKEIREEEKAAEEFMPYKKTYHTPGGRDTTSKWPMILVIVALIVIGGIFYSKYNHTSTLVFKPKTTTFEVKERISLVGSDTANKNANSLAYNLVYIPEGDGADTRNPFVAGAKTTSTTTTTTTVTALALKEYTMTASTTGDVKKISFVNKTNASVSLRETTRISVGDVVYNLNSQATIPSSGKNVPASTDVYHVVGFKDTAEYETVYAIPAGSAAAAATPATTSTVTTTKNDDSTSSVIPPTSIISLLPKTSLPLLKSNIYDRSLEQNAVVVIEQRDLEAVLQNLNPSLQEYVKTLQPLEGVVKYHVTIVDYDLEVSEETGKPVSFKSLTLEFTPIINADMAKNAFVHFGNDAMKKIQSQVNPYIEMDVSHFPFWMTDVPDADMVRVQVEESDGAIAK